MAMRVGPLSNVKVIEYINQHFIPVFISNEDVLSGKVGHDEKQLLLDIRKSAREQGLSDGTVHVYLVKTDLQVADVLHVAKASDIKLLMPWLRSISRRLNTTPGPVVVPPSSTTKQPKLKPGELLLQAKSQFNDRLSSYVDDWIVLQQAEWMQFVESPQDASQREWNIDEQLAKKILIHLYPYAADWDLDFDKIKSASMRLSPMKTAGAERKLSISGRIQRIQNLQPGRSPAPLFVEIVGIVRVGSDGRPQISLSTFKGTFGNRTFDGMVNSIAPEDVNSVEEASKSEK